ncbi:hypothetical protein ACG6R3_002508 [Enterococcus faecium]
MKKKILCNISIATLLTPLLLAPITYAQAEGIDNGISKVDTYKVGSDEDSNQPTGSSFQASEPMDDSDKEFEYKNNYGDSSSLQEDPKQTQESKEETSVSNVQTFSSE